MSVRGTLVAAVLGSLLPACVLELPGIVACGDGFVDANAGEECDPRDVDSYVGACALTDRPLGSGACDPVACTLITDIAQCGVCGDGILDPELGEACDGSSLGGQTCPGNVGTLRCSDTCQIDMSECGQCGNGMIDGSEECDPVAGNFGVTRPCAGDPDSGLDPLPSPFPDLPYTSGVAGACTSDCTLTRTNCGYCGNGLLDPATLVDEDNAVLSRPEWCDGDRFDEAVLADEVGIMCEQFSMEGLRPNVACAENCLGFEPREGEPCCRIKGARCPTANESFRCCYELDHPEDPEPCEQFVDQRGDLYSFCK